jgi:hypothetical protein
MPWLLAEQSGTIDVGADGLVSDELVTAYRKYRPLWTRSPADADYRPCAATCFPPHIGGSQTTPAWSRSSTRALHLDQADVARPGDARATGSPCPKVDGADLGGTGGERILQVPLSRSSADQQGPTP